MSGPANSHDPLQDLREYRHLAPWNLRDLTGLAAAILDAAAVRPVNAAAAARPSERTIRFYVARGLVAPPEGRGTAAIYSYRHLLQVLAIKLRQMEGADLTRLADEMATTSGDVLERRVAAALGASLPAPRALPLFEDASRPRGRAGRAFSQPAASPQAREPSTAWRRVPIADGIELHVRTDHPISGDAVRSTQLRDAVTLALRRLSSTPPQPDTSPRSPQE
jgi:hypothetical protein